VSNLIQNYKQKVTLYVHTNNPSCKPQKRVRIWQKTWNVSKSLQDHGVSRDTILSYQELAQDGKPWAVINDLDAHPMIKNKWWRQRERSHWLCSLLNRRQDNIEPVIELRKKRYLRIGSGVRSMLLATRIRNFKKRLKALEQKVARCIVDGTLKSQLFEKKKRIL